MSILTPCAAASYIFLIRSLSLKEFTLTIMCALFPARASAISLSISAINVVRILVGQTRRFLQDLNTCDKSSLYFFSPEKTLLIRSEEHTSELQSRENLVCRLLLEKKKHTKHTFIKS